MSEIPDQSENNTQFEASDRSDPQSSKPSESLPLKSARQAFNDSAAQQLMKDLIDPPAMRAVKDLIDSPALRAMRDLIDSPAMRSVRAFSNARSIAVTMAFDDVLKAGTNERFDAYSLWIG